jgi:hypothetical protein
MFPACARPPGKGGIDHPALLHEGSTVALIEGLVLVGVIELVAEQFRAPAQPSNELFGIGIDQEFVGIEAMAGIRLIRTVDAIAVHCPGPRRWQITVPHFIGVFRQLNSLELSVARLVE